MNDFTHLDDEGKIRMVDISDKSISIRTAKASGIIKLKKETINLIRNNEIKKGNVLSTAKIAGINTAKSTSTIVPLCHPIPIDWVDIKIEIKNSDIYVECTAKTTWKTGIEMEAMCGVMGALLSIYDMCKAVDKDMVIENIRLLEKTKENV